MSKHPSLPPALMTPSRGLLHDATIVERKPQIIRQVIEDNAYPLDIVARSRPLPMRSPTTRSSRSMNSPRTSTSGTLPWLPAQARPGWKSLVFR
jgi:hypothetical protein